MDFTIAFSCFSFYYEPITENPDKKLQPGFVHAACEDKSGAVSKSLPISFLYDTIIYIEMFAHDPPETKIIDGSVFKDK